MVLSTKMPYFMDERCEVGESWAYAVERSNHKDKFGVNEEFGKNNWDREIIVSNGKNIVMWTLNLEDNDFYE